MIVGFIRTKPSRQQLERQNTTDDQRKAVTYGMTLFGCGIQKSHARKEVLLPPEEAVDAYKSELLALEDILFTRPHLKMHITVGDVVLPGDLIGEQDELKKVVYGPGLRVHQNQIYAVTSGIFKKKPDANYYYVDTFHQKRYVPVRSEDVLGVVTNKSGDIFKVDIGSSEQASLSYLAFEGATKKNRPDIQVGDLVFAKLVVASRDMEPELVCVDSYGKKGKLGPLPEGGFVFSCSLNLVRKILKKDYPLFNVLGKDISYEISVGMNGKVWVKAATIPQTIAVCNAILAAEHKTKDEIDEMTKQILKISTLECRTKRVPTLTNCRRQSALPLQIRERSRRSGRWLLQREEVESGEGRSRREQATLALPASPTAPRRSPLRRRSVPPPAPPPPLRYTEWRGAAPPCSKAGSGGGGGVIRTAMA
ncbi:Uncharacterized protein GBIM_09378 [Gryllus bimaculatus]|nr:Uncharacterized protein GBIM_09378 [Gryllus bimaculatus]